MGCHFGNYNHPPSFNSTVIDAVDGKRNSRIAKVSAHFGPQHPAYEQALLTHHRHADLHNYPIFDLKTTIIDDLWNKPAHLLSIIMDELLKPEDRRLQWLFWFDRDTVILNHCMPLHIFLPPQETTNIIISNDFNGLNNGVFGIRVCEWSVRLLSPILGYRELRPDEDLPFTKQSAMEKVLQDDNFKEGVVYYPQRWFNAYPTSKEKDYTVRDADLLVHFAGVGDRLEQISKWIQRVDAEPDTWALNYRVTAIPEEIFDFWKDLHQQHK